MCGKRKRNVAVKMRVILAEKPSVAQDVAGAFRKVERRNGYIKVWDRELGEFYITWCFGHLFEIDTETIAPKGKTLIFPERFLYRLRKGAGKQFKVIRELIKRAREVYVFTDPEREGELIARLVLIHAGWKNWDRTYRFWTSKALTPDVVREEIKKKRPIRLFDSVYYEALARQHADWLVGINLSRVLMEKLGGVWSVGRVQTPTLALTVIREEERRNFKPEPYLVIRGVFEHAGKNFKAVLWKEEKGVYGNKPDNSVEDDEEEEEKVAGISPQEGKKILEALKGSKYGIVKHVKKRKKRVPPPPLHSLTTLQQEASKEFGFSAQKTLELAQSLYEKKLVSYPRTESNHLSPDDKPLVKEVLRKLGYVNLIKNVDKAGKRVFDERKLTDHFALIPLNPLQGNVSSQERKVYDLILRRFLGAFMGDFVYEEVEVEIEVKGYTFKVVGKKVIEPGWKALYGNEKDIILPALKEGERIKLKKLESEKRYTKPPKRYSEGSIVKKMKALELGTPATRAQIIDTLKKRGYVKRLKNELIPTGKGEFLIKKLLEKKLPIVSPELTSEWEKKLKEIRNKNLGFAGYKKFIEEIKRFVLEQKGILENLKFENNYLPRRFSYRKR